MSFFKSLKNCESSEKLKVKVCKFLSFLERRKKNFIRKKCSQSLKNLPKRTKLKALKFKAHVLKKAF